MTNERARRETPREDVEPSTSRFASPAWQRHMKRAVAAFVLCICVSACGGSSSSPTASDRPHFPTGTEQKR
jgi:hypothetical protein